jgi:inward rectifier potassium channel
MHPIDQHSPLHGRTPQELSASGADIVVSFSGIDEIMERPIHAHHNYPLSQVLFGQAFVDMMQEEDGDGQSFDFANFNRIYACPFVELS